MATSSGLSPQLRIAASVVVLGLLAVLAAGHPLLAHAVRSGAVEVLFGGLFGLRLGGIEGRRGSGLPALLRPATAGHKHT